MPGGDDISRHHLTMTPRTDLRACVRQRKPSSTARAAPSATPSARPLAGKAGGLVLVMHLGDRPEARVDGVRNVRLMRNARAIRPACGGTLTLCTFRDFGTCSIPVEAFSWPMLRRPSCW